MKTLGNGQGHRNKVPCPSKKYLMILLNYEMYINIMLPFDGIFLLSEILNEREDFS